VTVASAPTPAVRPVEVEALEKVYGEPGSAQEVRAVDGVSFVVERGESVAIIGPSGCGKSSLLNVLGCLDRPTSGTYRLSGRDMASMDDDELAELRNHHIGFVFQSFHLLPRMNAVENVELPLLYAGTKNARAVALEALSRVGLADRGGHLPNQLSGGQKQRVAIARAIVTRPSILLCDEPTGALDSKTGQDVLELLFELNGEGATLIMVTHDLGIARHLGRAIHMRDGKIQADGRPSVVVAGMLETELG
jgi:putative ABC transport system ATP-binding protein